MINQLDDRNRNRTSSLAEITLLFTVFLMAGCATQKDKSITAQDGGATELSSSGDSAVSPTGPRDLEFEGRLRALKKGATTDEMVAILGSVPSSAGMSGTGDNPFSMDKMEMYLIYERKNCSYDVVVDNKKRFVKWRKSAK